jgi:uncharacterized repeat protein (TIGR01451 family)
MKSVFSKRAAHVCVIVCVLGLMVLGLGDGALPVANAEEDVVALDEADDGSAVDLRGDQELVIALEGNLSTGYLWQVASVDDAILQRVGQFEFQQYADVVGSAGQQTLRFRAAGEGRTDLVLAYRRSWEDAAPLRTFSINVQTAGPITPIEDVYTEVALPSQPRDVGPIGSAALPTTYEWCSSGGCTPVKNQGGCGSCWAFATSGVVESLVKISDGVTRDLAEQYLVSCNTHGWDCDGGSRAFDYFINRYAPAELAAGAVYEADYPYTSGGTGTAGSCTGSPHTKHEKLISWDYVAGGAEFPTVAQIQQAIYDYGPVYVSVCAGPAWNSYGGGIFSTDESSVCGGGTNHGVVLVGWNDSQGVWYLRNSWGTSWGESLAGGGGYMRIAYGTSNVGRWPSYAIYEPSPNVGITKNVVGSDLAPGDPVTFTLTIGNSGDKVAAGVIVTDVIPAEVLTPSFASTLAVTQTGAISYVWQVEPLSVGESGVITIYGWIDPSLPSDFFFANSATISDPEDTTPANNVSSVGVGEQGVYLPLVLRSWPPIVTNQFDSVADATVVQAAPTTNFGSTSDMWTGYDHCSGAQITRSLVRFNLSSIPSGTTVYQARLYLYLVNSCDIGERTHTVTTYRAGGSWSESSVTWNTSPGPAEAYGSASIPSRTWGWYSFDVTDLVRAWVNGSVSNYGLMVRGPESSGNSSARLGFATREAGGGYAPYLEVTYVGEGLGTGGSTAGDIPGLGGCGPAIEDALDALPPAPGWKVEFETITKTICPAD